MLTTRIPTHCLFLLLTMFYASSSFASDLTIKALMQTLAEAKPSHATFIEKKYIALLDEPVESTGELFFTAPSHLEKRTLTPKKESLIVDGNKILIERGSKTLYFTMQNLPELGVFINSIRGTLAGDLNTLQRHFKLSITGTAKQWQLTLIPTNQKMQALLQHIQIAGLKNQIKTIEVTQVDGDYSSMAITPLDQPQ